jgi:hypothetical protein
MQMERTSCWLTDVNLIMKWSSLIIIIIISQFDQLCGHLWLLFPFHLFKFSGVRISRLLFPSLIYLHSQRDTNIRTHQSTNIYWPSNSSRWCTKYDESRVQCWNNTAQMKSRNIYKANNNVNKYYCVLLDGYLIRLLTQFHPMRQ